MIHMNLGFGKAKRNMPRKFFLVLAGVLSLSACQDREAAKRAEQLAAELASVAQTRDSLVAIVSGAEADKDRAITELADAARFAEQIDAELRQVRGLTSQVKPQTEDESGRAQANAAREDILARLKQLRQRLNNRQAELQRARDSLVALNGESSASARLLEDLHSRLALRDREIAAFESEVRELREANVQLTYEKAALADTVRQVSTEANRVFYTVGTKQQLLDRKIVTQEGGSRALLLVRLGRTLVPSRTLDEAYFTAADKREILTIPLPRSDKNYRIVSRHDAGLIEAERKDDDGSFRGASIRITDPSAFWSASAFLIIVEK